MKFIARFSGRPVGAIGMLQHFCEIVEAEDSSKIEDKIYEKWEHISDLEYEKMVNEKFQINTKRGKKCK